jgi:hypothetical protein
MLQRWKRGETVLWGCGVALTAFATAFIIASPYSLVKLAFLKGLYYEAVETGAAMNVRWLAGWTRGVSTTIGLPILVALAGTILGWLVDRRRHVWTSLEIVLFGWSALYLVVLLTPVHELALHYALPLIAPAAILAARVAITAAGLLAWRLPQVSRTVTTMVIVAIVACFELSSLAADVQFRETTLDREHDPQALAGAWLVDHVPSTSRVVYDYWSYVPPTFTDATATWGASSAWLASLNPDVVVVNDGVSPLWHGSGREESYSVCLVRGTCGYRRVFTLQPISIFLKCQPANCGVTASRASARS